MIRVHIRWRYNITSKLALLRNFEGINIRKNEYMKTRIFDNTNQQTYTNTHVRMLACARLWIFENTDMRGLEDTTFPPKFFHFQTSLPQFSCKIPIISQNPLPSDQTPLPPSLFSNCTCQRQRLWSNFFFSLPAPQNHFPRRNVCYCPFCQQPMNFERVSLC